MLIFQRTMTAMMVFKTPPSRVMWWAPYYRTPIVIVHYARGREGGSSSGKTWAPSFRDEKGKNGIGGNWHGLTYYVVHERLCIGGWYYWYKRCTLSGGKWDNNSFFNQDITAKGSLHQTPRLASTPWVVACVSSGRKHKIVSSTADLALDLGQATNNMVVATSLRCYLVAGPHCCRMFMCIVFQVVPVSPYDVPCQNTSGADEPRSSVWNHPVHRGLISQTFSQRKALENGLACLYRTMWMEYEGDNQFGCRYFVAFSVARDVQNVVKRTRTGRVLGRKHSQECGREKMQ